MSLARAGNTLWTVAQTYFCTSNIRLVSDQVGGCYAYWSCFNQQDESLDAFATHLGAGGVAPGWSVDGSTIDSGPRHQRVTDCAADGFGGAFLALHDSRSGLSNIYAVHVGPSGAPTWPPIGRIVCDQPSGQDTPIMVASELGRAIIAWGDPRNGAGDLYAQRISLDLPVAVTISLVEAAADPSAAHLVW